MEEIADSIGVLGDNMVFLFLILLPLGLTVAMFWTRQAMLGFPCAIFWAVLGGYAYTQSSIPWVDWQYYLFFASAFGMVVFTALAAFGLREKRDTLADESLEKDDGGYIDEGGSKGGHLDDEVSDRGEAKTNDLFSLEDTSRPSKRTQALRDRARQRREGESTPRRSIKWR